MIVHLTGSYINVSNNNQYNCTHSYSYADDFMDKCFMDKYSNPCSEASQKPVYSEDHHAGFSLISKSCDHLFPVTKSLSLLASYAMPLSMFSGSVLLVS